jgi:hypothetical protein
MLSGDFIIMPIFKFYLITASRWQEGNMYEYEKREK